MLITTYYAIVLSFSASVAIAVGLMALRRRSVPGSIYLSLMMLAIAEWSLAAALEAASITQNTKIFWSQISYVGVSVSPTLFLLFSLKYWRPDIQIRRLYRICIWLLPVVTILVAATNGLHHLLWNSFTPESPDTNVLIYGHAIWFYINIAYSYLLMLIGVIILFRAVLSHPQLHRRQALVVLIAAILPWICNIIYVTGFDPLAGLDLAPVAFSVTGLILAFGIAKFQLLKILPLARELLFQKMSNGVLVVDDSGHIVDFNLAAENVTGKKIAFGQGIEEVLEEWPQIISGAGDSQGIKEIFLANREMPGWIEVRITSLYTSRDKPSGRLILLQDITERKKAEEALRESEERFRQMVDLLPEAVCEFDTSGNILFGNRAAFIMVGYDQADFEKGLNLLPMVAPEDQERALTNIGMMMAGEALGADEYTLVRKDGSRFPATVHIANILNASGKTVGFRGIIVDITARRQAVETQQRLAAIVTSSHDAIIGQDLSGLITDWNKGAEERYGYSAEEAVGRPISMLVAPEKTDEVTKLLAKKIKGGEAVLDYGTECITKDGRRVSALITLSPIKDASGKVVGASSIAQDITVIKQAEEKSKQIAAEWQTTFDSIADLVSIQSKDFKLVRVNKAYADAVGMRMEDIVGKHCYEVVHSTASHIVNCPHRQTIETKKAVTQEVFEPRLNAYLEVSTSPIFDSAGKIFGSVHIAKNITERKKVDMALRERLKELSCLYGISDILEVPGISLGEILERVALIIPAAWQFPDITEACIVMEGQAFQTAHFRETPWMQAGEIIVNGKPVGQIKVCYLEERPASDEGPFIIEERHLLDAIAERLSRVIERVWAEETLQEIEDRYRSLYVDSRDAVMILSPDEGFLSGNPAAIEMFGCRDEQDFTARAPASLSPEYQPDGARSVDKSREMMRIALEKGSYSFEWTHRRADGIDFMATVLLSRMEIGGKRLLQATVRDITESKQAAEVLRQFVDRLSLATRAGGVGIWDYDVINNKLIWDDQMYRLYGITPDKFGGAYEAWRAGLHPEDMQRGDNEIQMALRGEKEFDTEFRVLWPDGTIRNIRAIAILQRDACGKPLRMIGTNWDITERKKAEEALRESEDRIHLLLDSAAEAIYGIDMNGNCTFCNSACLRMLGYKRPDELLGRNMHWQIHSKHPDGTPFPVEECRIFQAFRSGKGTHVDDEVLWRFDGTSFAAEYWSYPLLHDGVVSGAVVTFLDITERKRSEEMIRIRLSLLDFSTTHSLEELLQKTLDEVGVLTGSPIGFYHFVEKDQKTLSLQAWSTRTVKEFCKAEGQGMHYGIDKAGVWVDCVRQRRPVIHNDYLSLSNRKGLPAGHAVVVRELVVPIMRGGDVVAILGIGNKPTNYTDKDVEVVSYLADVAWEITERKRAQEALRDSEEKIRGIFDAIADSVTVVDMNGKIIELNESAVRLFGIKSKAEAIGMDGLAFVANEDLTTVTAQMGEVFLAGKTAQLVQFRYKRLDGTIFYGETSSVILHGAQGNVVGLIGVIRDVTERRRLEGAIRESEKKFRTLFEDSIDAVVITTVDGKILDFNDSLMSLTGYGREELLSLNAVKLYASSADREMFRREIQKAGSVKEYEVKWIKKDGTGIDVVMTLAARRDEGGSIIGYQGIVRDVTERKRLESMLKASEKRFRELADFLPQTICEIDLNGRFTYANKYGIEAHGYTKEEIEKSLNAIDLFIPAQRDRVVQNISRVLSGQSFDDHEYSVMRKDGTTYSALIYTNAIVRNGQVVGVRALVVDITERKKIEQMKTDFVSFISHQLRTPVAGLMGYIDNMLDGVTGTLNDMQVDYLRDMRGVCERNSRLIYDLLSISRLERGVLAVNITPVDLRSVVEIAVKEHRKTIEEKGLALNIRGIDRATIVLADNDKLVEVLKNVIHNTTKVTSAGSISIEIVSDERYGVIKVSDTGIGMSKTVLQGLFTKERVFGGAMAVGGGAGLGLYIAKGFMQLQHGDITAESVEGKGSTFSISLPINRIGSE